MFKKYEKVLKKDYEKWYKEHKEYREQVKSDPRRFKISFDAENRMA